MLISSFTQVVNLSHLQYNLTQKLRSNFKKAVEYSTRRSYNRWKTRNPDYDKPDGNTTFITKTRIDSKIFTKLRSFGSESWYLTSKINETATCWIANKTVICWISMSYRDYIKEPPFIVGVKAIFTANHFPLNFFLVCIALKLSL